MSTTPLLSDAEPGEFMRQIEICHRFGISDETWRRWRASGKAPAPIPNLPGFPRWRRVDIDRFAEGREPKGPSGRRFFSSARRLKLAHGQQSGAAAK